MVDPGHAFALLCQYSDASRATEYASIQDDVAQIPDNPLHATLEYLQQDLMPLRADQQDTWVWDYLQQVLSWQAGVELAYDHVMPMFDTPGFTGREIRMLEHIRGELVRIAEFLKNQWLQAVTECSHELRDRNYEHEMSIQDIEIIRNELQMRFYALSCILEQVLPPQE